MRITTTTRVDGALSDLFYELYLDTFAPLRIKAAARHILDPDEWRDEMTDERVVKIIAWDGDEAAGLSTLATDITALPWVNAEFYFHRYPGREIYYCGISLVRAAWQGTSVFSLMMRELIGTTALAGAVQAFDCSKFNVQELRMIDMLRTLTADFIPMEPEEVDTQHYWVLNLGELLPGFELPSARVATAAAVLPD